MVLIYGGMAILWGLIWIYVLITMSLKALWKVLSRIFKRALLLFFPEFLKRYEGKVRVSRRALRMNLKELKNLYERFDRRYSWASSYERYIGWYDALRYVLFDSPDVFDKIMTINQQQQDFFYDHGYTDVKGYHVGQEIVCSRCIKAEEISLEENRYVTADESEKGCFCDRCKKQLPK